MSSGFNKRLWVTLVALALAGVLAAAAARWWHPARDPQALTLSGNIEAHESVLSFKTVQSRIVELPFDEGKWLKKGTVVARVDDADYRQQIAMAQAQVGVQERQLDAAQGSLTAAQKTVESDAADLKYKTLELNRLRDLAARGFVSKDARDLAEAAQQESSANLARDRALEQVANRNVALARAAVHNAEEARKLTEISESDTTLVAPFDGVILVRQTELGEAVAPGTPIVTLADLDHVWLRAYVNETDIGRIRLGEDAVVTADSYPDQRYRGRVSFIAEKAEFTPKSVETHAERVTLVYRIRIDVDNLSHELVPGMPADATVPLLHSGQK